MTQKITRLSESILWQLQSTAYAQFGVKSWTQVGVPFHITNNARIAKSYAQIAHAAMRDAPMTILEIGGGSGKFAFLFITELLALTRAPFQYLLTDCAEKNVLFWQTHPYFASWIKEGRLRTDVYDPLTSPLLSCRPDLVIANYVFDTVPQDLFRIEQGKLFEGMIELSSDDPEVMWDDPKIIPHLQDAYSFHPCSEESAAHPIVKSYQNRFENLSFFLPVGALQTLNRLRSFCRPDCLFLAADRGICEEKELVAQSEPHMSLHGTFSFPVNFHAIGEWMRHQGGESVFFKAESFDFAVTLSSFAPLVCGVRQRFSEQMFGSFEMLTLEDLEKANWDPTLFFSLFKSFQQQYEDASEAEKQRLEGGMRCVRERFFPLSREEGLLLDQLGLFWQTVGNEVEAKACFERALDSQSLPNLSPSESLPKHKPELVQEIEKQFSFLETIVYADADLEVLLAHLEQEKGTCKNHVMRFFTELRQKNNVTERQFEWMMQKLMHGERPIDTENA
ncbi:MAG: hypothetical protein HY861_03945 [Chlamydiia bacterium]|nr:hypothetical protein [Chlamydiia bacterium]